MLDRIEKPELFFGIVAPIGVDTGHIIRYLAELLQIKYAYSSTLIKITDLMREIKTNITLDDTVVEQRYHTRIEYANAVRARFSPFDDVNKGNDALAMLTVRAIQRARAEETHDEQRPWRGHAYILDQFKRPEEILLLRRVYGRLFIQISIHATKHTRRRALSRKIRESHPENPLKDYSPEALELIRRDLEEESVPTGQRVRDVFHLADVIIDADDRAIAECELGRFLKVLFGYNFITPVRDEYGMYLAKSASLRSADLSRQVGAAIFTAAGELISIGSNEVPKAGGGTYFEGDTPDYREYATGGDFNEQEKRRILKELIIRIRDKGLLKSIEKCEKIDDIVEYLLLNPKGPLVKKVLGLWIYWSMGDKFMRKCPRWSMPLDWVGP